MSAYLSVCILQEYGAHGSQKRVSDLPELELQVLQADIATICGHWQLSPCANQE